MGHGNAPKIFDAIEESLDQVVGIVNMAIIASEGDQDVRSR